MITIKIIDKEHKSDINIPSQPFPLFGLMLTSYINGIKPLVVCILLQYAENAYIT